MRKIEMPKFLFSSFFLYLLIACSFYIFIDWQAVGYHRLGNLMNNYRFTKGDDPNVAILFCESLDEIEPKNLANLQLLSYNLLRIGDTYHARKTIEKALRIIPLNDVRRGQLQKTYELLK